MLPRNCAETESRSRTQSTHQLSGVEATNAMERPSGENTAGPAPMPTETKFEFSGADKRERIGTCGSRSSIKWRTARRPAIGSGGRMPQLRSAPERAQPAGLALSNRASRRRASALDFQDPRIRSRVSRSFTRHALTIGRGRGAAACSTKTGGGCSFSMAATRSACVWPSKALRPTAGGL